MTTTVRPYRQLDEASIGIDFSISALAWALGEIGFDCPVVHVHPGEYVRACNIVRDANVIIAVKSDATITSFAEWWIEWQGKAIGSEGA